MNSAKGTHELQQGISRAGQEGLEERVTHGLPVIHAFAAHSDQQ